MDTPELRPDTPFTPLGMSTDMSNDMSTRHSSTVTLSQHQLPIWPEQARGIPNALARSALFNVANVRKGEREYLKRHTVAALAGIDITYTGLQLRQDDEDVFLQITHICRVQELGTEVRFTAYSLLTELGWTKNSGSYKRLVDCLDRLKASSLAVTIDLPDGGRSNYTGSLIRSFRWRESSSGTPMREWTILLEKEIIALFPPSYSRVDWKIRLTLGPLAKWLHSFFHTHATPFPLKVETLHRLTGSQISELRKFRYKLKLALNELVEKEFFVTATIDPRSDLVKVVRRLAISQ
jgi:hypothetical protein